MNVIKSPNDKKEYRVIKLDNGLTAMLISDLGHLSGEQNELNEVGQASPSGGADSGRESDSDEESLSSDSYVCTSDEELEVDGGGKSSHQETRAQHMAAAALCVQVGSFSDPEDVPGLAHFLEHMLFMGNEKYPRENYYDSAVARYGGSDNAFTDCERTIYYFTVRPKYLREVLDIFASCFTSPLLNVNSMEREIEAVDSEFSLSSPRDSDRMDLLLGSCAKKGHPMTNFFWGNTKTLKDDPKLKNINVCERLKAFWKRYYSSHCMTLAVTSTETLDVLEGWVREKFSSIPCNGLPPPSFEDLEFPFQTEGFHKLYKVIPVKEMHRLVLSWALPPMQKFYRVKPLRYLGWILGHEGKGSIMAFLRRRFWAFELEAGNGGDGFEFNSTCSLFRINIELTEKGMDNVFEVISVVFQYLTMLRMAGPQKKIFEEVKDIEDNYFRFQEEVDKSDYVEEIAQNMQCFPSEHYLVGDKLYFDYDEEVIRACEDELTFENANVIIFSSRFATEDICNERETWTRAAYCHDDFPEDWVKHLNELEVHPDLHLPEENHFIAKIFTLKEEPAFTGDKYPIKIFEDDHGALWYKKDAKFNVPKGYICFHLISPLGRQSAKNAAAMDLWMSCLHQILSEDLYPAVAALLSYALYADDSGLVLQVSGFDHTLKLLFEEMLIRVVNFSPSESLFVTMKNQLFKSYYNILIKPGKLSKDVRLTIIQKSYWSVVDKRIALKEISRDDLLNFSKTFLSSIYFEGLVQGNYMIEEALSLCAIVKEQTNAVPLSQDCFFQQQTMHIPDGEAFCCVKSFSPTDPNSVVVNYYQSQPGTIKTSCLMELLLSIMEEPCFDILRTKETLGYDVSCSYKCNYGIIGFCVMVRSPSNKFSCTYVDQRIEAFLRVFASEIQSLSEEEFSIQKSSLIDQKKCEDLNLKEEASRNWSEIVEKNYLFDRLHKEIECLQTLTLEELQSYAQEHLLLNGPKIRKLGVQVVGPTGIVPNASKIQHESAGNENVNTTEELVYDLHFLGPSESDENFVSDILEYRSGLKAYEHWKIV